MPDLSHLWQRFVLACALLFGLVLGVGATVFGYSNTATVRLGWSVFMCHLDRTLREGDYATYNFLTISQTVS